MTNNINAGCYVFKRGVIDQIPAGRPVSVEREVFPQLLADGRHVQGHVDSGYWRDMGTPEDFVRGSADLVRGIAPWSGHSPAEALVLDGGEVDASAIVGGGTTVGRGARVDAEARVHGSVLLDGAVIEEGAVVEDSSGSARSSARALSSRDA